jgi:AcrR family transcriptional regulator
VKNQRSNRPLSPPPTKYSLQEGLGNLTLRAITRRTGVSHGAPRRYFPTHNSPGSTDARERAIALWTNVHGLVALRATRALDLLGDATVTSLLGRIVHIHLL